LTTAPIDHDDIGHVDIGHVDIGHVDIDHVDIDHIHTHTRARARGGARGAFGPPPATTPPVGKVDKLRYRGDYCQCDYFQFL